MSGQFDTAVYFKLRHCLLGRLVCLFCETLRFIEWLRKWTYFLSETFIHARALTVR